MQRVSYIILLFCFSGEGGWDSNVLSTQLKRSRLRPNCCPTLRIFLGPTWEFWEDLNLFLFDMIRSFKNLASMTIGSRRVHGLGVVDTIYEDEEAELQDSEDSCSVREEMSLKSFSGRLDKDLSLQGESSSWIVFENPRASAGSTPRDESLESIVCSWSEAIGIPTSVTVHIMGYSFNLHKFPLVSKSGYFQRELIEANEIYLSSPGGAETFELIAAHCYGAFIPMGPSTIAAIRCASEFFEMTEDYYKGNLCKLSHRYFNDVVLKSWDHAIETLKSCEELHPMAQELNIVGACVEAISLLSCSETEKQTPISSLTPIELTYEGSHLENLIEDLINLPLDYFRQIIESIRRKGIQVKFICRALFQYTDRWVFDVVNTHGSNMEEDKQCEMKSVVESLVKLLPVGKNIVPVSFLFGLLRCALAWNAGKECTFKLENRIAAQLEQATVADFLLPWKNEKDELDDLGILEMESMQHILSLFMSQQVDMGDESDYTLFSEGNTSSHSSSSSNPYACNVAKVWDEYLAEVATYSNVSPNIFLDLLETVSSSNRSVHDQLYKAIHIYFKTHPQISDKDKTNICRMLNCQKLSQDICFHAVQNDLMPLRMIVQAMYMHQLQAMCHPRQPSRSGSLRSSQRILNNHNIKNNCEIRSYEKEDTSLGSILRKDRLCRQASYLMSDLEETNSKLRSLEEEIKYMKKKLSGNLRKDASTRDPSIEMPAAEEFSKRLKNMKKSSELANKGCGGGGIAQRLMKSLQKLRFVGITKSKVRHTPEESTSRACGQRELNSGNEVEVDVEAGQAIYDDDEEEELRHPKRISSKRAGPMSSSCRDINYVVDESVSGWKMTHERSQSLS